MLPPPFPRFTPSPTRLLVRNPSLTTRSGQNRNSVAVDRLLGRSFRWLAIRITSRFQVFVKCVARTPLSSLKSGIREKAQLVLFNFNRLFAINQQINYFIPLLAGALTLETSEQKIKRSYNLVALLLE